MEKMNYAQMKNQTRLKFIFEQYLEPEFILTEQTNKNFLLRIL